LEPLRGVRIAQKSVKHSPQEKILDALVGVLCGCKALFLKETLGEVERVLSFLQEERDKRERTRVRIDGSFGTGANLNWLIWRGYQFVAKGYGVNGHPGWQGACQMMAGKRDPPRAKCSGCQPPLTATSARPRRW
jgi:hypothetical protein